MNEPSHAASSLPSRVCLGLLASVLASVAALTGQARAAEEPIRLLPHRAVFDLKLDPRAPAKGVDSAKSRIVYDFSGDACAGYDLSFRQVIELEVSELGKKLIDSRSINHEEGDGTTFRFKNDNLSAGGVRETTDGEALRSGEGYAVKLRKPKPEQFTIAGDALFPTAQLKAVIRAARAGQSTVDVPIFDGSDNGRQLYDSFTVIGRKIEGGPASALEEPLRKPAFENAPRWPVTISYFKQQTGETTPAYRVSFELFENGVTRAVRFDYGDFVLIGEISRFDTLPVTACAK